MTEEAPLTNSPEARTATGEIINQGEAPSKIETASEPTAAPVVPEAYSFTALEGQTLDEKLVAEATPIFKELGLSQESAQKLVDMYNKQTGGVQAELVKQVEKVRGEWRDQVKADPVMGKDLDKTLLEIGRAKDRLPTEIRASFNEAMDLTGAGDHPAIVRALYELAKLVNEGTHVAGGAPSVHGQKPSGQATRPSMASAMYPNLPQ